jgi:hypothetical protein
MSLERDTTRIVRSWLENGSTALPDRVLDAVLSELPSTPQRRLLWSPRRTTTMAIRIAALAAILLLALVGAAVIGTSGTGPRAPSPIAIAGTITTLADPSGERPTTAVDMTVTGSNVAGTVVFDSSSPSPLFTLGLECVRRVDADTWIFGGHVLSTTSNGPPVGHPTAFIYRQGAQPKSGGWFEGEPHAADCPSFLAGIDLAKMASPNWMWDVVDGALTIPAAVGG